MRDKKFFKFLKSEHGTLYICYMLLVLLPLFCCMAYSLKTGNSIKDIYLPASQWNDEIIYYKEVEGMVQYGMPLGYFGYSENHAQIGTLSVWSPVLLLPWYLWGVLFGWNMLSPVWCNIVLLMVAMAAFCMLARPNKRQCLGIAVCYVLFLHFTRYAMSAQVEVTVYAFLLIALGLVYSLKRCFSYKKIVILYFMLAILGLMRPYLILLSVIPAYLLAKKKKAWVGIGAGIILLQLVLYFVMTHYFCSPYLDGGSLLGGSWMEVFIAEGFKSGIKNLLYVFLSSWNQYMGYIGSSLYYGSSYAENAGAMFALMFGLFCYKWYCALHKRNREEIIWNGFWVCYFVIMLLAAIYLFASGQKHMLCFVVLGLFIMVMDGLETPKFLFLCYAMAHFFVFSTTGGGYAWGIPYVDLNVQAEIRKGEEALNETMKLSVTDNLYDNTVVWVFDDVVGEDFVHTNWQMLYALPPGMGINMCLFDSLASDLSNVQSKYIFVAAGGRTDEHCQRMGARKLVEYGDSVIYQLRE